MNLRGLLLQMRPWRKLGTKGRFMLSNVVGSTILVSLFAIRYSSSGLLGTRLLLGGWDTPFYSWHAAVELRYGTSYMLGFWQYPQFYTQLLALLSWIAGDVVLTQRILPLVLGCVNVWLISTTSLRISRDPVTAYLTALLAPVSIGTLWLVSEFHRNHLAYLVMLALFLRLSRPGADRRWIDYAFAAGGLFIIAGTQFETYAIGSLTLLLTCALQKNWKNLQLVLAGVVSATGALLAIFPSFITLYYLNPPQQSYVPNVSFGIADLIFWTIGFPFILPVFLVGFLSLYRRAIPRQNSLALNILLFSLVLIGASIGLMYTSLVAIAIRPALLVPVPIILAMGIRGLPDVVKEFQSWVRGPSSHGPRAERRADRLGTLPVVLVTIIVLASLTFSTSSAVDKVVVSYVSVPASVKIQALASYLSQYGLEVPVVMFHGPSLWVGDEYRAYLGIEVGEHLAYYGDLQNLSAFIPTRPPFPYPADEIAYFTSVKYLREMTGVDRYLIFPEKSVVRNYSELRSRPIAFLSPEVYGEPVPFYILRYRVSAGLYVVPTFSQIENYVNPIMTLQSDGATRTVNGTYLDYKTLRVDMGQDSSWYRLTSIPNCFALWRLTQGGAISFPEFDPRRPSQLPAIVGNDPAEDINAWKPYPTLSGTQFTFDSQMAKEGQYSLRALGKTDAYGGFPIVYGQSVPMDLSHSGILAFWAQSSSGNVTWVLTLFDSSGRRTSYWHNENEISPTITAWNRLVFRLGIPTDAEPGFDLSNVTSVIVNAFAGRADMSITVYIDDFMTDVLMDNGSVYKGRIRAGEDVVAYFRGVTEC